MFSCSDISHCILSCPVFEVVGLLQLSAWHLPGKYLASVLYLVRTCFSFKELDVTFAEIEILNFRVVENQG